MGYGMGINLRGRAVGAVLLGAAAGMLALPGSALAEEGPDKVIANDCAATLEGEPGEPLTADAGALVQAPGVVTVGLGSSSDGTNGEKEPLVKLPVTDTLDGLGVTETPVVSDAAGTVCDGAKTTVNTLGNAVQGVVPGDDLTEQPPGEDPPDEEEPPGEEDPPGDEQPPGESPGNGNGAGSAIEPIVTGPGAGNLGGFDDGEVLQLLGNSFGSLGVIALPPAAELGPPVTAPDINAPSPGDKGPAERSKESGTVQAAPAGDQQNRLPLLLAVIALAVVATLLSRTLYRRKSL